MEVVSKIIELRKKKGFSQKDLAKKLNIAPYNYGKVERGETKLTVDRLDQIAQVLGVHISSFFDFPTDELNFRLFFYLACEIVGHDAKFPPPLFIEFVECHINDKKNEHIAFTWFIEFIGEKENKNLISTYQSSSYEVNHLSEYQNRWALWHNIHLFKAAFEECEPFFFLVIRHYGLVSSISKGFTKYFDYIVKKNERSDSPKF